MEQPREQDKHDEYVPAFIAMPVMVHLAVGKPALDVRGAAGGYRDRR